MKILIAEDDPLTLDALASCIESEGFTVLRAANGREAVELWRSGKPDLLCLDIMMPYVDGYEVCRRVRASDRTLPILFLSAKNQEIDVVVGLDLGADDFIRKPYTRSEVMARIRAALRRSAPREAGDNFLLGDLTVRPRALLAEREDKCIELTPREVSMLCLLHIRVRRSHGMRFSILVGDWTITLTPGRWISISCCCGKKSRRTRRIPPSSRRCARLAIGWVVLCENGLLAIEKEHDPASLT
jgi:DNA-binding response OmpR family regulator